MVRLFLAINLPEHLKKRLAYLQQELARSGADVRWVRPEGIHLTLKFFGEVSEEMIDRLAQTTKEVVQKSSQGPMRFTLKGLGTFPSGSRPRVVWVGLEGDLKRLSLLQHALEKAFEKLGFEREKRAFVPHLTLGRVKSNRKVRHLLQEIQRHQDEAYSQPQEVEVKELILYQSILKPSGAVYLPLKRIPLKE